MLGCSIYIHPACFEGLVPWLVQSDRTIHTRNEVPLSIIIHTRFSKWLVGSFCLATKLFGLEEHTMEWVWQWSVRSSIQHTFVVWAAIPKQISNTHAAGGAPTLICNSLHNKDAGCVLSCDVTSNKDSVVYSARQIRRLRTLLWRHIKQRLSGAQCTSNTQVAYSPVTSHQTKNQQCTVNPPGTEVMTFHL